MRTLLVASQKGGVGKTTTAVNLASIAGQSGSRVLLLDADPLGSVTVSLQLLRSDGEIEPHADGVTGRGAVWANVLPNVDVVSPYPATSSSESDLQDFVKNLRSSAMARDYDHVIIDAPPMLGPRPKALMMAADEAIFVQRAEPMSFRTLPAYLNLLREVKNEGGRCQFRGILLTMPPGSGDMVRATASIRAKFKGLLPQTIPFSAEVNHALVMGQPIADTHPDSEVARQYESLAATLGLIQEEHAERAVGAQSVATANGVATVKSKVSSPLPAGLEETYHDIKMAATEEETSAEVDAAKKIVQIEKAVAANATKGEWFWLLIAAVSLVASVAISLWLLAGLHSAR